MHVLHTAGMIYNVPGRSLRLTPKVDVQCPNGNLNETVFFVQMPAWLDLG